MEIWGTVPSSANPLKKRLFCRKLTAVPQTLTWKHYKFSNWFQNQFEMTKPWSDFQTISISCSILLNCRPPDISELNIYFRRILTSWNNKHRLQHIDSTTIDVWHPVYFVLDWFSIVVIVVVVVIPVIVVKVVVSKVPYIVDELYESPKKH